MTKKPKNPLLEPSERKNAAFWNPYIYPYPTVEQLDEARRYWDRVWLKERREVAIDRLKLHGVISVNPKISTARLEALAEAHDRLPQALLDLKVLVKAIHGPKTKFIFVTFRGYDAMMPQDGFQFHEVDPARERHTRPAVTIQM